jgi:hypothetical protein
MNSSEENHTRSYRIDIYRSLFFFVETLNFTFTDAILLINFLLKNREQNENIEVYSLQAE